MNVKCFQIHHYLFKTEIETMLNVRYGGTFMSLHRCVGSIRVEHVLWVVATPLVVIQRPVLIFSSLIAVQAIGRMSHDQSVHVDLQAAQPGAPRPPNPPLQ